MKFVLPLLLIFLPGREFIRSTRPARRRLQSSADCRSPLIASFEIKQKVLLLLVNSRRGSQGSRGNSVFTNII
jgi:hypothetical protein